MKLQMVGCGHHHSPVQVRERLAFSPQQAEEALKLFRGRFPESEVVLLSTCNRVELYTASEDEHARPSHHDVAEFLGAFHGLPVADFFDDLLERTGEDTVRHLFTVAASLDSMVVGEPQILSQVKQAYQLASQLESTGPLTHNVFQSAIKVARRVANETSINERRVSIPSVAVGDFARNIFDTFHDKRVLVIGAGEMGEETLRYLREEGAQDIVVLNRSPTRALELAEKFGGHTAPWSALHDELVAADLVVSTTGASEPIVNLEAFHEIESRRYQRPLFILDLAIPRDFDPAIENELNVYLYSIDDLRETCKLNQNERDRELPAAIRIVEEETDRFMANLWHRSTGPIIERLKQGWEGPKEDELRRLLNKLPDLNEREQNEIRISFDRLVNKLLHPPMTSLRDEARHGTPHGLLDALTRLFHLKD